MDRGEFPLEVVLRHRKRQEEERQLALACAQRQLDEEWGTLEDLRERSALALVGIAAEQARPRLDLDAITRALAYVSSLKVAIAAQEQVVREATRRRDEERARLLRASQEARIVEKLKENWLVERQRDLLQREEKVAAESAISRFSREVSPA